MLKMFTRHVGHTEYTPMIFWKISRIFIATKKTQIGLLMLGIEFLSPLGQGCELKLKLELEKLGHFAKFELEKLIFLNSKLNSNKTVRV